MYQDSLFYDCLSLITLTYKKTFFIGRYTVLYKNHIFSEPGDIIVIFHANFQKLSLATLPTTPKYAFTLLSTMRGFICHWLLKIETDIFVRQILDRWFL